ncbi:rhodanese [Flavobacterium sp. 316]|uniref:Rhodanese-like domain-containing protein n=1 Tax=Flavobacterium sediminilitoris TaxID=2024526 RepID=A0ABY4HKF9_9FLAO|nr:MULTISPECIES: rhodanese-like domain-containing protein [Flavobacterium]KIX22754.1 rhodanese [Flavobacterium sp. 316]UOX33342.1 rhodanese-like domain-containing protein [Flavobacterium sediminilitoris]
MNLDQQQWWNQFLTDEKGIIVDVRTEEEVNRGRIPGSINIDIFKGQGFIYQVEELDKEKNYYVYCAAGSRSANACNIMRELGFTNAYNLVGGISEWEGPIEN